MSVAATLYCEAHPAYTGRGAMDEPCERCTALRRLVETGWTLCVPVNVTGEHRLKVAAK